MQNVRFSEIKGGGLFWFAGRQFIKITTRLPKENAVATDIRCRVFFGDDSIVQRKVKLREINRGEYNE